jgi:short-subunit dehydrogenase
MIMNIAIVTGASSGLGSEFVKQISQESSLQEIWVIARRKEKLEALSHEIVLPLKILPLSLADPNSFKEIEKQLEEEHPHIAWLINNAGTGWIGPFSAMEKGKAASMISLNCMAPVSLIDLCLPYMNRGSHILNVCSVAGFLPLPGLAVYSATKSFLLRFSRALREELKTKGISVTALCPYWIQDTEFIQRSNGGASINLLGALRAKDAAAAGIQGAKKNQFLITPGWMSVLSYWSAKFLPWSWLWRVRKIMKF